MRRPSVGRLSVQREDATGPLVRELLEEARLVVESISTSFRPLAACGSAS